MVSEFKELSRLCKRHRDLRFTGDYRDYHLERMGQSCLYNVLVNQRGAIEKNSWDACLPYMLMRVELVCRTALLVAGNRIPAY
jgi:hypothetical protein